MDPPAPPPRAASPAPLGDVLSSLRALTTFSALVRTAARPAAQRLADPRARTTVLAPLNSAVDALPRKLWEDPREYDARGPDAYHGPAGRRRADLNLCRFVESHLVAVSPWPPRQPATTLAGRELWWELRDGKMVVMPDEVEVQVVASRAANGEVWILQGVLNYHAPSTSAE